MTKLYYFQFLVALCWVISLVCVSSVIFGQTNESRGNINSVEVDSVYNAVSKTVWSLGLAWIIFACNTGYGG